MRLAGWRGRSLPIGGRLLLVNSVLTAMLSHAMSSGLLPKGVVEAIDKRRRAFLWTGEDSCSGGQCKVAWTDVCTPKALGGLGVLSIPAQNEALLSKFLTKLHSNSSAPWACWFRRWYGWTANRDLGDPCSRATPVWKDIASGLATFRSITFVRIQGGETTAFWHDSWLGDTSLSHRFPALYSHATRTNISVASVYLLGIPACLAPRLTTVASQELLSLTTEIDTIPLLPGVPDIRLNRATNKELSNRDHYANSFRHLLNDEQAKKGWRSFAPLKCKIFLWLAHRRRLPTNTRRFRHNLTTLATCPSCMEDEDVDHLLTSCPKASEVWIHFQTSQKTAPHSLQAMLGSWFCSAKDATISTAIAWNIWKRRNSKVFNNMAEPLPLVIQRCISDIRLWAQRCSNVDSRSTLLSWCNNYDPP